MTTADAPTAVAAPPSDPRSGGPWPGPASYARGGPEPFIGRESETATLVSLVQRYGVILLHAPSGAGKSSLVNAGVVPELERHGFTYLGRARVLPHDTGDPTENPYGAAAVDSLVGTSHGATVDIGRHLIESSSDLDLDGALRPTVVVFDQFEEILHLCPDHLDRQEEFMEAVGRAARARPNLHMIFVTRDDALGPILRLGERLGDGGFGGRLHLDLMRTETAKRLLTEPAAEFGRPIDPVVARFVAHAAAMERLPNVETDESRPLDSAARQATIRDTLAWLDDHPVDDQEAPAGSTTSRYVSLVTLQVVASRLWSASSDSPSIEGRHLIEIEGVEGALENFYVATVRVAADASERAGVDEHAVRSFFEHEVISSADVRQMVPEDQAVGQLGRGPLDALLDSKLLRRLTYGATYVELCHDSFIEPIRTSNQARRRELREARDRTRRRRIKTGGLAVGTALLLAAGGGLLFGRQQGDGTPEDVDGAPRAPVATLATTTTSPARDAPVVQGRTEEEAVQILEDAGFVVSVATVRSSAQEGTVISQEAPNSGTVLIQVASRGVIVRDDDVLMGAGESRTVDVLANDEAPARESDPLEIDDFSTGDPIEVSQVGEQLFITANEPGEYLARYTVVGSQTAQPATVRITVVAPLAAFSASGTTGAVGDSVQFVDISAGANLERVWRVDGEDTSRDSPFDLVLDTPGSVSVELVIKDSAATQTSVTRNLKVEDGQRTVTIVSIDAILRDGPGLESEVIDSLDEATGTELVVRADPTDGWYEILAPSAYSGNWIFGALVLPQSGTLRVGATNAGEDAQLFDSEGRALDVDNPSDRLVLVDDPEATDETMRVLLATGETAFVRRADVTLLTI